MMKCRSVQKRLSAYQDRELEPKEEDQVRNHLLSCRACCEQYAEIERVWKTVGQFEEIHPDQWFYRQLVRKLREPREQGQLPAVQWAFQIFRAPAIASIILIVGLAAGTYFGNLMARYDFFPIQPVRPTDSQEALFDSLKAFDPVPPGTLAHGYLQIVNDEERESK